MDELEKQMYYGATPVTIEKAKHLRSRLTTPEALLWDKLKGKKICNVRFRRQHPIDTYIVDFYCHAAKLVIEIDGKIHLQHREYDSHREKELNNLGIKILRFTNSTIENNIENAVKEITLLTTVRIEEQT